MEAADRRGPGTAGGGRQLCGLPAAVTITAFVAMVR